MDVGIHDEQMDEENIKNLLRDGECLQLTEYITAEVNQNKVKEKAWDYLSLIMIHLKENAVPNSKLQAFADIFMHLSQSGNHKELVLGILEQFDPMVELILVELLIAPLGVVCNKLMKSEMALKTKCSNMSMVFSSLSYYCESLNLPNYDDYDPVKKTEQAIEEAKILRYVKKCLDLANFTLGCLQENLLSKGSSSDTNTMRIVTQEPLSFYCNMLERMALVNLNEQKMLCDQCHDHDEQYVLKPVYTSPESVCAKVIHLMHLVRQPWTLLCDMRWDEYITLETKCEEDKKTILARGCYLYLVYVKGHEMEKCPQVIDSTFSFVCCFYAILTLMKSKNPTTVDKGLELCRHFTNKLHPFSLHYNKLTYDLTAVNQISKEFNEEPVLEVLETAISIAVQCPSRTLRQRGIQFVAKFLDKFAWLDRAHLLHRLLFTTQHYGVKGYLSGYFKDKLSVILQESSPPNCAPFISNPRFSAILDQILILSNGSESDLLQEHDLVMSGLNLLRFLLIRDSKHQTCIWNRMKKIEENYISPLRTGLNLSRMHYKEELRKIMNPKKETPSSAFALNGIDLPSIPVKERKQVIESAIHSFDMMQGVCSRVQQLIDEKT